MRCDEIMKTDVECVAPKTSCQEAAERMRDENIGFLPVCDSSQRVVGTLTDRDICVRLVADGQSGKTPVSDVMTSDVVACRPQDDIRDAERLMGQHHKSRIVCVDDDGRLVGVISLSDIVQYEDAPQAAEVLRQVSGRESRAGTAL